MKVRVLGCSGAIAKGCRTTSFLMDESVLIDAGTGVGDLTLDEMRKIDHVYLTHSHLDHIAALPLMLDAVSSLRQTPVQIHALPQTLEVLSKHIFNNVIWPDFSSIPSAASPFMRFCPLHVGEQRATAGVVVEALPAVHTVPAVGYAVRGQDRKEWWVFSGDTERNPAFWDWINRMPVCQLVMETAFSDRESSLAATSLHLSPTTLALELAQLRSDRAFPIYISHTKPSETSLIMEEIQRFGPEFWQSGNASHSLHRLTAGQTFDL